MVVLTSLYWCSHVSIKSILWGHILNVLVFIWFLLGWCYIRRININILNTWYCIFFFALVQEDLRYPRSLVQNTMWTCVNKIVEPVLSCWPVNRLRDLALRKIMKHVHYEDESTNYINLCPIVKVMYARTWSICLSLPATQMGSTFCTMYVSKLFSEHA